MNGRLYFSNANAGDILSISTNGGELHTHYSAFSAKGVISANNGKINLQQNEINDALSSIPLNSEGISRISGLKYSNVVSIASDGTYIYWTEYQSGVGRVVRASIQVMGVKSNFSPLGYSVDELLPFSLQSKALLALDGTDLFVLDIADGIGAVPIYKIDLTTGSYSLFTSIQSHFTSWALSDFQISVNQHFLYVYDGFNILQIDKTSGTSSVVVAGVHFSLSGPKFRVDANSLYWWQLVPYVYLRDLMKLDSQTGLISNLVSISSLNDINDFASDGVDIWWFETQNGPGIVSVFKMPATGGPVQLVSSFLDSDYVPPHRNTLFMDQSYFYWNYYNWVLKMSKAGGAPTILTKDGHTSSVVIGVNDTHLVWKGIHDIRKMPKTGQPDPVLIWQEMGGGAFRTSIRDMTEQNNVHYWISRKFIYNPITHITDVYSYDGNTTSLLETLPGFGDKIVADNSGILAAYHDTGYKIAAIPLGGGAFIDIVTSNLEIKAMNLSNEVLYFIACDGATPGGLYAYDLNTLELVELVDGISATHAHIYIDDVHIYWSENFGGVGGALSRIPIGGGAIESIYNDTAFGITGDALNVCWLTGFSLMKRAK